ncbi:MAG: COX15/CtaA family protein, partial [Limisphaerales bacterium]
LVSSIALFTTQFWQNLWPLNGRRYLKFFYLVATSLIFFQLILWATMRHQHAGLAIPDFPAAYGKIWPDLDAASVAIYNQNRMETGGYKEITAFQIVLQMAHRIGAILILISVVVCAWKTSREFKLKNPLTKLSLAWVGLILIQIFLGAATIWKGKAADMATAHVAVGAISLLTGAFLCLISFRVLRPTQEISRQEKILKPVVISQAI